jgi:hypothetical protein
VKLRVAATALSIMTIVVAAVAGCAPAESWPAATTETLQVRGRQVVDTCGRPFVVRGVESYLREGSDVDGSMTEFVRQMTLSGANAIRLVPDVQVLSVEQVEQLITTATRAGVVVFVSPGDRGWFTRPGVKEMLDRHRKWLVLDVFQEPEYDDRARWLDEAVGAVRDLRAAGYDQPITVMANQYGRDLPAVLQDGATVVGADPRQNTIMGWQAYWGIGEGYQRQYGLSLSDGVREAARAPFPIQLGIDRIADTASPDDARSEDEPMDFATVMSLAQETGTGWLWWEWGTRGGYQGNALTRDGLVTSLTEVGEVVVNSHPDGIRATARKACGR